MVKGSDGDGIELNRLRIAVGDADAWSKPVLRYFAQYLIPLGWIGNAYGFVKMDDKINYCSWDQTQADLGGW